jgi:hypothetical protein
MADAAKKVSLASAASTEKAARDNLATFAKVTGKPFPADAVEAFVRALAGALNGE